ncbi:hypothetical protein SO802_014257 [Lithocarpus litseifolius]|uniref:Disease resistance R13L4/SHOC-2-like LRR domain-containing protein n=1 Tax=Lithocarpus litseifolius TaxID=425828 RepID=A0AAW2CQJ9_9ROSI
MDFEGAPIDSIPKEVGNLFHLRYLSLRDTKIPVEISGLHKLRYLAAYTENYHTEFSSDFRQAVKIHNGIQFLQSLEKLFNIEAKNIALTEELGSLGQLRKLEISKLKRENGMALCTVVEKLSHLRSLDINATNEEEVLELQSMSSPLPLLNTLLLFGRLEKLPEWIAKLKSVVGVGFHWSRLMDDPLKVIQALPNLMEIRLYDGYKGEQLHIEGGGFQKLKLLGLRNLRRLNRLIIDKGDLPLLVKLRIGPCPQLKEMPSGIQNLKSLKFLDFYEMLTELVLSLQPDEGLDFWKVKHVPFVVFWQCGIPWNARPPFLLGHYNDCSINYHLGKANMVADALSRKSSSFSTALLTSQKEIIEDLERMGIEIVMGDSQAFMASLTIQPTLVEKIKSSQVDDAQLVKIMEEVQKGKIPEFNVSNDGVLRYCTDVASAFPWVVTYGFVMTPP